GGERPGARRVAPGRAARRMRDLDGWGRALRRRHRGRGLRRGGAAGGVPAVGAHTGQPPPSPGALLPYPAPDPDRLRRPHRSTRGRAAAPPPARTPLRLRPGTPPLRRVPGRGALLLARGVEPRLERSAGVVLPLPASALIEGFPPTPF